MKVIKPPSPLPVDAETEFSIFLAGSIEMGAAENWQEKVEKMMEPESGYILNPRRDDWDSSWAQTINNPQFRGQVEWELLAMEKAQMILMYFDPSTKSPISLLELGLHAKGSKLRVCCPQGFWRKGNVDITGKMYGVPVVETLGELVGFAKKP
jgi:hypothetical protein